MSFKNKNADGLRGLAALSVATHHFLGAFLPFLLHNNYACFFAAAKQPSLLVKFFSSPVATLFYNGSFPVMIFFVLSGYVLAVPYYHGNRDATALHRRLWGRYLRLNIPVAASILLSFLVYKCHGYFNTPAASLSGSTLWLNTFFQPGLSHITAFRDMLWRSLILGEGNFNPVYWSLKAEFIGSILLLLFYIAKPRGKNALFLFLVLLLLRTLDEKIPVFLFGILIGSLLHEIVIPKNWQLVVLLIGLFFGAFQNESSFYQFLPSVLPWHRQNFYGVLGALLFVAPIVQGYGTSFFQSRPLLFLGRISFPLYLLHFIILCSFSCGLYLLLPHTPLALAINFIFYLLITMVLSSVFEKYVDQPAIALSHRFSSFLFRVL